MKYLIYTLLIFNLFNSCKSNTKQETKDTNYIEPASNQTEKLIQKFKAIIQGVWVKKDYLDKVIKTKSPLGAADECRGITTMYINTDYIKGDRIVFMAGSYNHDGANVTIKFHPGKSASSILFNDMDLSYSIEKSDTTITIFQFDERKQRMIKAKYIRVLKRQPDDDLGYGMDYTINKGLIASNYIMTDTAGITSKVIFTNDGKVPGFFNFSEYNINIDLNNDAMDNLDMIFFRDKKTAANNVTHGNYSFKFNADTLSLYNTYPNADSTELILGKRIYKLVKQK